MNAWDVRIMSYHSVEEPVAEHVEERGQGVLQRVVVLPELVEVIVARLAVLLIGGLQPVEEPSRIADLRVRRVADECAEGIDRHVEGVCGIGTAQQHPERA